MAIEKGVCRNCTGGGHIANDCPLRKRSKDRGKGKNGSKDQLHMLLDRAMQNDLEYLCALEEEHPLALFPCNVGGRFGIALLDDGATRNYISLTFAKRAKLQIQQAQEKSIRLSNGNSMRKHGMVQFEMQMSEWKGIVNAFILY